MWVTTANELRSVRVRGLRLNEQNSLLSREKGLGNGDERERKQPKKKWLLERANELKSREFSRDVRGLR